MEWRRPDDDGRSGWTKVVLRNGEREVVRFAQALRQANIHWYRPGHPGARPEKKTVASRPFTETAGREMVSCRLPAGRTAPRPVAQRRRSFPEPSS